MKMNAMQKVQLPLFLALVAATHYYDPDRSVTSVLSAIISVSIVIFSYSLLISRINQGPVRTFVGFTFVYLLSSYYALQFISYYLQGSYFNEQFLFHFNLTTLRESQAAYYPLILSIIAWIACVCFGFYYLKDRLPLSSYSIPRLASLFVLAFALDPGLRPSIISKANDVLTPRIESLDDIAWEELNLERDALANSQLTSTPGKNLILVFLEGLEKIYTDDDLFPGLTPNIHVLNEEGWQLDNMQEVAGSTWTIAGIISSLCATPLVYESNLSGNEVVFSRLLDKATCLPDILANAGYDQVFVGGAALDFAGKGNFLTEHSFDTILGRDELVGELEDPSYLNGWGLYDDSLFSKALEQFNSLADSDQPFNLTMLTVDTHHPIGEPSASCSEYSHIDNSILHAVHCTDFLLGKFIDQIKKHPKYENTMVVLLSDHLAMRNNAFPLFPPNYQRRLYFNVLNADVPISEEIFSTPLDIAPTLLPLLAVQHNAAFLAGKDLANTPITYSEGIVYDRQRHDALRYINSNHLSSTNQNTSYTLNRLTLNEIDFSDSITNVEFRGGELYLDASSGDPYFILPILTDMEFDDALLYLTLRSTESLGVTLYFESEAGQGYSEENTMKRYPEAGLNELVFDLKEIANGSRIRIDPGFQTGRYNISELEIRTR